MTGAAPRIGATIEVHRDGAHVVATGAESAAENLAETARAAPALWLDYPTMLPTRSK